MQYLFRKQSWLHIQGIQMVQRVPMLDTENLKYLRSMVQIKLVQDTEQKDIIFPTPLHLPPDPLLSLLSLLCPRSIVCSRSSQIGFHNYQSNCLILNKYLYYQLNILHSIQQHVNLFFDIRPFILQFFRHFSSFIIKSYLNPFIL